MKEKLTRNIGLKILSIILAALLWLVITNVDDPVISDSFSNVPVQIINEDVIESLGQVYEITEGATINFSFAARRSIAEDLTVSDFYVTADFSKLSDVNAVPIDIKCPRYPDNVTITDGLYKVMKVKRENLVYKNFKVNVVQKGEPADGYYVAEKTTNTIIRVSGPKSKIERIFQIVVEVDVTDVAGSFRATEVPKALDKEGKEIPSTNLVFSDRSVAISIGMYKTKKIDLLITTSGEPAFGYTRTTVDYEPKTIEVAGEDLSAIQSLTINESIEGASQDIEKEVNIQEQMEDGLILVGDNQTAVVKIGIVKAEKKEILILPEDIEVRNKPADLEVMYLIMAPITVEVSAPAKDINKLSAKELKPYIDLSNYSGGTYDIAIGTETTDYTKVENNPTVRVYLKKQ